MLLSNQLAFLDLSAFNIPQANAQAPGIEVAHAADREHKELGIMVLLVESSLLDDPTTYSTESGGLTLKDHIFAYAQNAQDRLPHTRAIVMAVDANEDPLKIGTVLEKLYYEGVDDEVLGGEIPSFIPKDDNQLAGIVLVGNVPIPVVTDQNGEPTPSLYPYTDFYRKAFIYNYETGRYEPNADSLNPTPDIWHGVIVPPSKEEDEGRQQLAEFFDKNNQYSHGQGGYDEFDRRLLYYNFPSVEQKLNTFDYNNYKRSIRYAEEIAFNRFNRHLLKAMIDEIAAETQGDKPPAERTPMIDDASLEVMSDDTAKFAIQKFTNEANNPKNLPKFIEALRSYLSRLNPVIEQTGRWTGSEFDSLATLINQRDVYMQNTLVAKSIELENRINDAIEDAQESIDLINNVTITIHACSDSSCDDEFTNQSVIGNSAVEAGFEFTFPSFVHGSQVNTTIFNARDCNIRRGQKRPPGVSVLQNNSELVEANSTYNPDTNVIRESDDDPETEDDPRYRQRGGCVANNSFAVQFDDEEQDVHIDAGPHKCKPEEAVLPVFDMAGAKEIDYEVYDSTSVVDEPATDFIVPPERCGLDDMSFLQFPQADPEPEGFFESVGDLFDGGVENIFNEPVYATGLLSAKDLRTLIFDLYNKMVQSGDIEIEFVPLASANPQLNEILRALLADDLSNSYSYTDADGNYVEFNVEATTKSVNSVVPHREPTDETLTSVKAFITPSLPADGVRFVEFYKDDARNIYRYPNLFRVDGFNLEDVQVNLAQMIEEKDAELNALLETNDTIIADFFAEHFSSEQGLNNLVEPILWRKMGLDQKHAEIIDKYLNRDSFMPTPPGTFVLPTQRPRGYEVMHLTAHGSESEFSFALNAAHQTEAETGGGVPEPSDDPSVEQPTAVSGDSTGTEDDDLASAPIAGLPQGLFSCSENDGVEIWEWFGAVQCWLDEEILKADELLSLDESCGANFLPELEAAIEYDPLAIFDVLDDTSLSIDNENSVPSRLPVLIPRRTLERGERVPVRVKILNSEDKLVVGFLDDPLTFTAENENLISFEPNELQVFTGEARVDLNTSPGLGDTTFTANLGTLSSDPINIRVVDDISISLTAERITGGLPQYDITAILTDPDGIPISDVNADIRLRPIVPSHGRFSDGGLVNIVQGRGETSFFPNPHQLEIDIVASHPFYSSETLRISQPPNAPYQILFDPPADVPVGATTTIPIRIADVNGVLSPQFNGPITLRVTEQTEKYGEVLSSIVNISDGLGAFELKTANETAQINIVAEEPSLVAGLAEIPIVVRIDTDRWDEMFTQNLFASMVGFPAGNFFEEDYFAGVHLFNGKTQAAFAFMSVNPPPAAAIVEPNYRVQTTTATQQINVVPISGGLSMELFDRGNGRSLFSTNIPFNFSSLTEWQGAEALLDNQATFEATNTTYTVEVSQDDLIISHPADGPIAHISATDMQPLDTTYEWLYELDPDGPWTELTLVGPTGEVGRARLNLPIQSLDRTAFEVHPSMRMRVSFFGNSTGDPTGLVLFDPNAEPDDIIEFPENYGFEGDSKYILRFGGGSNAGEAVRFKLPVDAVLLGDPTVKIDNNSVSNLHYDDTIGQQIYLDSEASDIISIKNFEFNNDGIEDVAAVLKDGRIRLFEGGRTEPLYRDRGNIAFNADGALSLIPFDFKNDGYDDLLVATDAGRLGVMDNDREVVTRTDHKLNVGKKIYQVLKRDMDADGYADLITQDSRGDIRIFYNQTPELLAAGLQPPFTAQQQIPQDGMFVANYGFSLNIRPDSQSALKRIRDLKVRFPGMPQPGGEAAGPADEPPPPPVPVNTAVEPGSDEGYSYEVDIPDAPDLDALANFAEADNSESLSESEAQAGYEANEAMFGDDEEGERAEPPKLPWKEGEETETYFAPITDFTNIPTELNAGTFINVTKIGVNAERPQDPILDLDEKILYTIELTPSKNINDFVLADIVPDSMTLDEDSVTCEGVGCEDFRSELKKIYFFFSNLQLRANETVRISYQVSVAHTPRFALLIKALEAPELLERSQGSSTIQFEPLYDDVLDIKVSPPGNTTGLLITHHSHNPDNPREYDVAATTPEPSVLDDFDLEACAEAVDDLPEQPDEDLSQGLNLLELIGLSFELEEDEDFMDETLNSCPGLDDAVSDLGDSNSGATTPESCADDPDACAGDSMEDLALSVPEFGCFGGGCFPMPINTSFLNPPAAFPVISYPGTFTNPYGVYPLPTFFNSVLSPLGATTVSGTYNSLIRVYASPSLTAGVGISACFGPYQGNSSTPPASVPIPWYPPIGNCLTQAIPMSELPHCKLVEEGITQAMNFGNSVISDANSGIAAVNSGNIPAQFNTSDNADTGGGGVEVSLGVNLGGDSTFEPPAANFSNIHIPSFDSVGGAIGSWVDRQFLEIINKLTKLPTIRVIIPDIPTLFTNDWERFNKMLNQFIKNVKSADLGIGKQTGDLSRAITSASTSTSGTNILQAQAALETEILNFNTSGLDQIYQIANALPFFDLNEHHIDFKIPWLSYAQINDFGRDLQQSAIHYAKIIADYKETADTYECPEDGSGSVQDCAAKQVANVFIADLEAFMLSLQENIEVLNSYKNFPRDFILLKQELANYIRSLACYIDTYSQLLGGWLLTIQDQILGYVELLLTMYEVMNAIGSLMDVFTSFEDNCDICTNERNGNFGWYTLLGLVLPEIPIIKFPKWPDLTLDMSNFNAQVALEVPIVHFVPEPITLPKIDRVVFPDVPTSGDLDLLLQIPELPVLPRLPEMPEFPDVPALPVIDLPTLPPPPKLPDIAATFEVMSDLMQAMLTVWCLVKKGFAPVPESYLRDHVTLLTNRPSYQTPLDFLNPAVGDVPAIETPFQELRVIFTSHVGLRVKAVFEEFNQVADVWNGSVGDWGNIISDAAQEAQAGIYDKIQGTLDDLDEIIPDDVEDVTDPAADAASEAVEGVFNPSETDDSEPQANLPQLPAEAEQLLAEVPPALKSELFTTIEKLQSTIKNINTNPVDYRIVKEQMGVPDVHMPLKSEALDKLHAARKQLIAYSDDLEKDAYLARDTSDLLALADLQAAPSFDFKPTKTTHITQPPVTTNQIVKTTTPADVVKELKNTERYFSKELQPKLESRFAQSGGSQDAPGTEIVPCIGTCLVDPITDRTVQFIPHFDNPSLSRTTFAKIAPGRSHVVYSDGPALYVKVDQDVAPDITFNQGDNVPNVIFDLDHFLKIGDLQMPPREAVNMMAAALTENGAATFTWLESTHPDLYGYGVQLERSILGYDVDQQNNELSDVTIVLLPPEAGSPPKVWVDDVEVPYGTLITSHNSEESARAHFGVKPKGFLTGASSVRFETISNLTISLNENKAVLFDKYQGPSYRLSMDNGFHHIKMTWFDQFGRIANYNQSELLAPQIYVEAPPPIDILFDGEFIFPIFKEASIPSTDVFTDLGSAYQYQWISDQLGEQNGDTLIIPPQREPGEFNVTLRASASFADASFPVFEKEFPVTIYVPEITLDPGALQDSGEVMGTMQPLEDTHDLTDIPFSLFRKRWGTWKNLGIINQEDGTPTTPPLSDLLDFEDNYYADNNEGDYQIIDLQVEDSPVLVLDGTLADVAEVVPETGQVIVHDPEYHLQAVPASEALPTRVSVVKKNFDIVMANVYYIADANTDVRIIDDPITAQNAGAIGVTIGDTNPSDTITAANLPGYAESYPGGAAIFDEATQQNIALINTDGAVRMMLNGYFFRIKNEAANEPVIFEIVDSFGNSVFDIFIAAEFENLEIRQDESWNELAPTLGFLKRTIQPMFASLLAQNKPSIPRSTAGSPFPDLDEAHPYFKAILDLYERRIVSGFGDGLFRPDARITRAEFIKIALGSTNCFDCANPTDAQIEKYSPSRPFPDVNLPAWFYFCIAIAKELGMVTGYGDGQFRPNQNISRAEAAAVLLRQSGIELSEAPEEAFLDVTEEAWYRDYVYTAVEIGLIKNNLGFVFPDEQVTRGELAFMASGVLNLQDCRLVDSDEDGMPDWWEVENNLDPLFAGDALLDNDGDVFTNLQEYQNGTNPNQFDLVEDLCPCIDNPNQNDTDGDGTIDPCDEDLDGDTVTNVLCMFDDNGLIDPIKAAESEDNCIFNENTDQLDFDADRVGDICSPGADVIVAEGFEDAAGNCLPATDPAATGDACPLEVVVQGGIDQCPNIPEDLDGVDDLDGCPEVDDLTAEASPRIAENEPGVYVNKGPLCFFLDYEADIVEGDTIMTVITDQETHEIIYKASNQVKY